MTHRKIVDYKICKISEISKDEVRESLKEGWELYGSPYAVWGGKDGGEISCQAMVKYEEE